MTVITTKVDLAYSFRNSLHTSPPPLTSNKNRRSLV